MAKTQRQSWHLQKEQEKLYKKDCLFVENKQDLKEISSFISWGPHVMQCRLVNSVHPHWCFCMESSLLVWPTLFTKINVVCLSLKRLSAKWKVKKEEEQRLHVMTKVEYFLTTRFKRKLANALEEWKSIMDKVCSLYMYVQNHLSFLQHLNGVALTNLLVTYLKTFIPTCYRQLSTCRFKYICKWHLLMVE